MLPVLCLLWCVLAMAARGDAGQAPAPALFGGRSTYDLQTTLLLNELAGKHRDVGYRLRAALVLEPVWADPDEQRFLLKFRLQSPELLLRGSHQNAEYVRRGSLWDSLGESTFYALWHGGRVLAAYLDHADPPDVLNYKRSLISLFQFQILDGEYKETDVSGDCDVMYETISPTVFRKIKRRCSFEAAADAASGVHARRVSRYTLNAARDALSALHAEELVWLAVAEKGEDALGVKARSWHALALRSHEADAALADGAPASLRAALAALPAPLVDTPLPLPLREQDEDAQEESLESALRSRGAALAGWEAGAGGEVEEAAALAPLLRAVRAAPAAALRALLDAPAMQDLLPGVCRALGLAGSEAAWLAVRPLLAPAERDALEALAHHYLAGFALSAEPQEGTVVEILKLGEDAKIASIATSALLAGAAGAARCGPSVQRTARDQLARGLARCRDEPCRAVRLRALGHLRLADSAALLLAAAERGGGGEGAEAALSALRAAPLSAVHVERLVMLASNASRSLTERALALELAADRSTVGAAGVVPLVLVRLARALGSERGAAAHELRRALWQRLDSLAEREAVRALHRVLPRDLRSWDARAHAGTTNVLRRATGWAWGGWVAQLDSAQLASRGLLRRGAVTLLGAGDGDVSELLSVEVWTRGLQAMAGGSAVEEDEEQEAPAAGLQLAVRGAALRPVPLFDGQAELLGHVWAGSGSAPTPVLRALAPLGTWRARLPLQAGAVLAADGDAAGALALDAHATVSLWHRTARAGLALRAAAHARASGGVHTAWSSLRAAVSAEGAPRLRLAADLDFYEAVALCVRADLAPYALRQSAKLESTGGARALRVTRTRTVRTERAGRTLSLGRDNDAACRVLRAADAAED